MWGYVGPGAGLSAAGTTFIIGSIDYFWCFSFAFDSYCFAYNYNYYDTECTETRHNYNLTPTPHTTFSAE